MKRRTCILHSTFSSHSRTNLLQSRVFFNINVVRQSKVSPLCFLVISIVWVSILLTPLNFTPFLSFLLVILSVAGSPSKRQTILGVGLPSEDEQVKVCCFPFGIEAGHCRVRLSAQTKLGK